MLAARHAPPRGPRRPSLAAAARKQQKQQKPKQRKPKPPVQQRIYVDAELAEEEEPPGGAAQVVLSLGDRLPNAPSTNERPADKAVSAEELYAVFPRPQQPSVTSLEGGRGGKWSWGEDRPGAAQQQQQHQGGQDAPLWNPRTGFMRTRAQQAADQAGGSSGSDSAEAQEQPSHAGNRSSSAAAAGSRSSGGSSSSSSSSSGGGSGGSAQLVEPLPPPLPKQQPPPLPKQQPPPQPPAAVDLPAVGRGQVLASCAATSAAMAAAAAGLHVFAQTSAVGLFGSDQAAADRLLRLPAGLESAQDAASMLGAAALVTAVRLALLRTWPAFAEATDRSNRQVLAPLGWADIALIAALTGVSEELLFRGGLIPATLPDWRGAAAAGVLFGALHVGGGRNAAFAAWATGVGWLYGAAFLLTGNVWVPAGAHALANFASAAAWRAAQGGSGGGGSGGGGSGGGGSGGGGSGGGGSGGGEAAR